MTRIIFFGILGGVLGALFATGLILLFPALLPAAPILGFSLGGLFAHALVRIHT